MFPIGVLLAPLAAFGLLSLVGVATSGAVRTAGPWAPLVALRELADIFALVAAAIAGYAGTWLAVVVGADRLRARPRVRWIVVACLIAGLSDAAVWQLWVLGNRSAAASTAGWLLWALLLVPSILVALHQLFLLVSRGPAGAGRPISR